MPGANLPELLDRIEPLSSRVGALPVHEVGADAIGYQGLIDRLLGRDVVADLIDLHAPHERSRGLVDYREVSGSRRRGVDADWPARTDLSEQCHNRRLPSE